MTVRRQSRALIYHIGAWRDSIRIDQSAVKEYAAKGLDIKTLIADKCPGNAPRDNAKHLSVQPDDCLRCMHCINK